MVWWCWWCGWASIGPTLRDLWALAWLSGLIAPENCWELSRQLITDFFSFFLFRILRRGSLMGLQIGTLLWWPWVASVCYVFVILLAYSFLIIELRMSCLGLTLLLCPTVSSPTVSNLALKFIRSVYSNMGVLFSGLILGPMIE